MLIVKHERDINGKKVIVSMEERCSPKIGQV